MSVLSWLIKKEDIRVANVPHLSDHFLFVNCSEQRPGLVHNDEISRSVESSDHSFSLAWSMTCLSVCTCDILVQEVSGGRDGLLLMCSVFAVSTRQMTEDCGFSVQSDLSCFVYLL